MHTKSLYEPKLVEHWSEMKRLAEARAQKEAAKEAQALAAERPAKAKTAASWWTLKAEQRPKSR